MVDLTSGKIEKEPLSERLRLNYLGGRGNGGGELRNLLRS